MGLVQECMESSFVVTKTISPDVGAIRHFGMLNKLGMLVGDGASICLAGQALPIFETVWSLPAGCL